MGLQYCSVKEAIFRLDFKIKVIKDHVQIPAEHVKIVFVLKLPTT